VAVAGEGVGTGAGASTGVLCQVCDARRRRARREATSVRPGADDGPGVVVAPTASRSPAASRRVDVASAPTREQAAGRRASTDKGPHPETAQAPVRTVKAASTVRSQVESCVKGGEIFYWKDVAS